jgi:hypothetical protein
MEGGKMFKLEDFDELDQEAFKSMSQDGAVLIYKCGNSIVISTDIKSDDPMLRSTENGPVLSQEGLNQLDGMEYILIPENTPFISDEKEILRMSDNYIRKVKEKQQNA